MKMYKNILYWFKKMQISYILSSFFCKNKIYDLLTEASKNNTVYHINGKTLSFMLSFNSLPEVGYEDTIYYIKGLSNFDFISKSSYKTVFMARYKHLELIINENKIIISFYDEKDGKRNIIFTNVYNSATNSNSMALLKLGPWCKEIYEIYKTFK